VKDDFLKEYLEENQEAPTLIAQQEIRAMMREEAPTPPFIKGTHKSV